MKDPIQTVIDQLISVRDKCDILTKRQMRYQVDEALTQLRAMQETDLDSLNRIAVRFWKRSISAYNTDIDCLIGLMKHLASQGRITCKQNATTKGNEHE